MKSHRASSAYGQIYSPHSRSSVSHIKNYLSSWWKRGILDLAACLGWYLKCSQAFLDLIPAAALWAGMKHEFHIRWRSDPDFSVSTSPVASTQPCPGYTFTYLVIILNIRHFLERKLKRHRKIEKWKQEHGKSQPPRCGVMLSAAEDRGMGWGFALPCCSRHICRGAPRSEPSCVCSGWRTEKSSSHTLSTGKKKNKKKR